MNSLDKRAKVWCVACDKSLVSVGTKCKLCNTMNINKSNNRDILRSELRKYLGLI